ncbi:Uncharacterised protein [Vibrio cholerae]|nr:Uncharacterised protein [Vibrio cholerae]
MSRYTTSAVEKEILHIASHVPYIEMKLYVLSDFICKNYEAEFTEF